MLSTLPAQAQTEVDLALVITTRISYALDIVEQRLQRRGIARAFHATLGNDAICYGMLDGIGVTCLKWDVNNDPSPTGPALCGGSVEHKSWELSKRQKPCSTTAGPTSRGNCVWRWRRLLRPSSRAPIMRPLLRH